MTPQQRFDRAQCDALPLRDMTSFEGLWVAVRRGEVVAANRDLALLRADDVVQSDDAVMSVPSSDAVLV